VRGLNALAAMPRLRVPLLLISEEDDWYIPPADARAMYQAAASRDKELQILPGTDHAFQMLNGPNSERVRQLILDFLAAHR
jgi:pimeloyl-ACP methyl ester carboxylesterase